MHKRIFALILLLALLNTMLLSAGAVETPDLNRLGSVSITMAYQSKPIFGGNLTIYKVADVVVRDGSYVFTYTDDFRGCTISLENLSSAELPQALAAIAADQKLTGTTRSVSREGKVLFSSLRVGLYLVVQNKAATGYKKINPFLVSVPYNDNGRYVYNVDTAPKNLPGPETEPTTKPTETTKPGSKLPQTGQNNWPIPALAAAGVLSICAGLCLLASGKKKNHET